MSAKFAAQAANSAGKVCYVGQLVVLAKVNLKFVIIVIIMTIFIETVLSESTAPLARCLLSFKNKSLLQMQPSIHE